MNTPTLRHQLAERKAAPDDPSRAMPTDGSVSQTGACFAVVDKSPGIKFTGEEKTVSFPYSHYLFSELVSEDALAVRFATHRIVIMGERLELLLDELTLQRLSMARVLPKRQRDQSPPGVVWIGRIEIAEVRSAEGGPRSGSRTA